MDMHGPLTRLSDTTVGLGTSSHGGTGSGGQSSSHKTSDTFQGHGGEDEEGEDEEQDYEGIGPSQLQDAPST